MCEPGDSGLKLKGYTLRAKLAMKRISVAWMIGAGVIVYLGFTFGRLHLWSFWLLVIALASLGVSGYFGGLVAERTARAFSLKGDWPSEGEVGGPAYLQKLFIYLAVLLVLAGLVASVYVRQGPVRPVYMGTQPSMQERGQQTPMRPMNPRGGTPDVQPAPGGEQPGRLERQAPRSQRDRGVRQPGAPPQPPEGGQKPPAPPEGG